MRLLYRADGGQSIGTGHLLRARRILDSLRRLTPLDATIVSSSDPAVRRLLADSPDRLIPLDGVPERTATKPVFRSASMLPLIEEVRPDCVVVDMLDTDGVEMGRLAETGVPLASFDDRGAGRTYAALLVNILVEEAEPERLLSGVRLCEGGAWATLSPVFTERGPARREIGACRRVLVTLGGGDAAGLTQKVARSLVGVPDVEEALFVCGVAFPFRAELEAVIAGAPYRASVAVGLPHLYDVYSECDLAIIAGGLTMFEACCTGTPAVAVCQPVDHQVEMAQRLESAGAILSGGRGDLMSEDAIRAVICRAAGDVLLRRRMAQRGPAVCDGRGADRVAEALLQLARRAGPRA